MALTHSQVSLLCAAPSAKPQLSQPSHAISRFSKRIESRRRPCLSTCSVRSTEYDPSAHSNGSIRLWESTPDAEGPLEKPEWSGEDPLSKFVNSLISFKPLFAVMKLAARQLLIGTATKAGIPWRQRAAELKATKEIYEEKELLEDKSIVYPFYYTQQFHAYTQGNLCWEAAFEVEPATLSMCLRAIPWVKTADEASYVLRGGWLRAINSHHLAHSDGLPVRSVLDVGCSVGISTRWLADKYPDAEITGLDLSPYFLAVASYRQKEAQAQGKGRSPPIKWVHALGESTGFPDDSFDIVSLAFVLHECPRDATIALLKEAHRILRPGGTFSMTDNSPKSKIIQRLPAPIFTLMKSTEPWSDQYYNIDMDEEARQVGFRNPTTVLSDPRHRTFTATA